jgi:hypothetical protein
VSLLTLLAATAPNASFVPSKIHKVFAPVSAGTLSKVRTLVATASTSTISSPFVVSTGQSKPYWPVAEPGEILDYALDVTAPLADIDDSIEAVAVCVAPSGFRELQVSDLIVEGNIIALLLGEGVASRDYTVRFYARTTRGLYLVWYAGLLIDPSTAPLYVPPPFDFGYGKPIIWPPGEPMFGPARPLVSRNIAATGTTQVTATVAEFPALWLINIAQAAGAGVCIGVPAIKWDNRRFHFTNGSGVEVVIYPFSGDQFLGEGGANEPMTLQNDQSVELAVSESGIIYVCG